jgi:succinoglycan biosynthesis transport protein ExoP
VANVSSVTAPLHVPQSNGFLELKGLWLLVRRQWKRFALVSAAVAAALWLAYLFYPFAYTATATLMLDPRPWNVAPGNPVLPGIGSDPAAVESEVQFMQSSDFVWGVIQRLQLDTDQAFTRTLPVSVDSQGWKDAAVARLVKNMTVTRKGLTYVVEAGFTDKTPERAARIANGIALAYVDAQTSGRSGITQEATDWLKERIFVLKRKVRASEQALSDFKAAHAIVAAGEGNTSQERLVIELTRQLGIAQAEAANAQARLESLKKTNLRQIADGNGDLQSATLTNLRSQYATITREYSEAATVYGERHPGFITAKLQIESIGGQINQEISRLRSRVAQDYTSARAKAELISARLSDASRPKDTDPELAELKRIAEADRSLYEQYLSREKDLRSREALETHDVSIISAAVPPSRPAKPKFSVTVVAIAFLSLVCGGATALVCDLQGMKIVRSRHQLRAMGMNRAVMLPLFEKTGGRELFKAALRHLLPALRGIQTVLVTSAQAGEGVTTVARAVADMLAEMGKNTLLLDMSYRDVADENTLRDGLADVVFGIMMPDQVMQRQDNGLQVFTAGQVSGHVQYRKLFSHPKFTELMDRFQQRFDAIIIDAPPALTVAGETPLLDYVDRVVLVTQWGKSTMSKVDAAATLLAGQEPHFVLGVANKVETGKLSMYEQDTVFQA